jgi:hypothetical protein
MESRNFIGDKRQNFTSAHTSPSLDIVLLFVCSACRCSALLRPHRKGRSFGEERERENSFFSQGVALSCSVPCFEFSVSSSSHHHTFWCSIEIDLLSVLVQNKYLFHSLSISSWWIVSTAHVFRLST